ncbi:DUF4350 domain-containing protein [Yinghuangia soli]|uniref:DUF4350 domain-containing protein n=1 Tax=Yinghuangia soli TaxID=2908204 RepID=UPI0027E339D3|nr:DUF4350 domain-containing protein [Yinghuangia soli]
MSGTAPGSEAGTPPLAPGSGSAKSAGTSPGAPRPSAASADTSISPDAAAVWRAARGPLLLAVLVLLVVSIGVLVNGGRDRGELDPRATDKSGSRAVAELLRRQGVDVRRVTTTEEARAAVESAPGTTALFVPFPKRLDDAQLQAVGVLRPARTILVAPGDRELEAFGTRLRDAGPFDTSLALPRCDLPEALRAGDADLGGRGYNSPDGVRCYPVSGRPGLVIAPRDAGEVAVLGSGRLLRNDRLDEHGNASLGMQLLGAQPTLIWFLPDEADSPGDRGLISLLPAGWRFGILQLGIAVVLLALYRARRLGPVVTEPLPVVVRATETAEGRARLYRRGRAYDRAAEELRSAARTRIGARLGLGAGTVAGTGHASGPGVPPVAPYGAPQPARHLDPAVLVEAVAARTGRSAAEVHHLLYGANPEHDAGLVALADHLDLLEDHVKTGVSPQ